MKNTVIKKSKVIAVLFMTIFLNMSSLCYSRLIIEVREYKAEQIIQKIGTVNEIAERMEINAFSKYHSDNSSALPMDTIKNDSIKGKRDEKIVKANDTAKTEENKIKFYDSTKYNMFGDLLNDDPLYNKKYRLWIPMVEVLGLHIFNGAINRYGSNVNFGRVGFNSWRHNINTGWEWDFDRFGMNFLAHPYTGGLNFTSARSNGYNFWESIPFAFGGSLLWEYFGENTLPSKNDIINTTISGAFFGEILYKLSSSILDDRTSGPERIIRELGAAVLTPTRFVNRFLQGKLTRVTGAEVYQKEPLNIELSGGMRKLNDGSHFGTGTQNPMINVQLDYGYPMEKRQWKPFDYFTVRAEMNLNVGRKIFDNVSGYGVIFGKNVQIGKLDMMMGLFQHYDYFDNTTFEIGSIAVGGGIMSKYPMLLFKKSYIFTNIHLGIVPLAGNSSRFAPDTSQVRDYNYGGGLESKFDFGLNLGWASIQLNSYFYWISTYVGLAGNNYIGIIKPRITVQLINNLNIGFEHLIYYNDRYTRNLGSYHSVRTEQRIYVMINLGNFKL